MKVNKLLETYIERMVESMLMEEDPSMASTPAVRKKPGQQQQIKQTFDMGQFQAVQGLDAKMRYLYSTLKQIGLGSSRVVFQFSDKLALKMAKNDAGVGQNKAEATVCTIDPNLGLFAKVEQVGQGYEWLLSEFALPMDEGQFQQLTHVSWKTFTSALLAAFPDKASKVLDQNKQDLQSLGQSSWFKRLLNVVKACKYEPGDIAKLDSWGIVNGRPVIIDSGFTEAVHQAFYAAPQSAPPAPGQQ